MTSDAQRIADAFAGGPPVAALDNPPTTVAEGYDLQDEVRRALGGTIVGWKLAQTVPKAQAAAGIDAPTVSPLLTGMIVPADTVFAAGKFFKPEVEAEIALELGEDIAKPCRKDELIGAIRGIRIAIEVADTRYVDKAAMGIPANIADMNGCGALVIGPLMDLNELQDAVIQPADARLGDGSLVPNLPADMRPSPLGVLAFLSEFACGRGHVLAAGTIVTTGTHTVPTRSGPGIVGARFESAASITARLSEPREAAT